MKRFLTLFLVACLFTLTALAQAISAEQSLHKAVERVSEKSYMKKVRGKADFALVHTQKSTQNGKALYYVFSNERNGGFVITGADRRANAVLGYTENGTYEEALAIPAFRSWLSSCEAAMQWLSDKEDTAVANSPKFDIPDQVVTNADNTITLTIPGRHYAKNTSLPASVEPLLGTIVWDQDDPYNRLCPDTQVEKNGVKETVKCATGCVATATSQVMKFWEWPKQGTGSHKYTSEGTVPVDLEADFSQSVYDWDNMLDDYSEGFTDEQANAVAKLMSDVGISVNMTYDESSGAAFPWTSYALATYFGYSKNIMACYRYYYTNEEWNDLMKKELSLSRPILFGGHDTWHDAGHAFVIDGYDEDGNYHVNWGWGGKSNGYFDINYMDPEHQGIGGSMGSYAAEEHFNVNCFPDIKGTSVASYQIVADAEPVMLPSGMLSCRISNLGIAPYTGEVGYVALIDDEVVGGAVYPIDELAFIRSTSVTIPFDNLGITPEVLGDKKCKIYPVFTEGDYYQIPLSKVAFQNYVLVSFDADGKVIQNNAPEDNAMPVCESLEITRDYAGFSIKAKAVITNEGAPTFDREMIMVVYDEYDESFAEGGNFDFIEQGSTSELVFDCAILKDKVLEIGKTYNVAILYSVAGSYWIIPGSETTVTIKDPGGKPSLTYSGYALDRDVIAPEDKLTVSFDAANAGGFGEEKFAVAVFKEGISTSLDMFNWKADLPTGTTTVTKTITMDYDEGKYFIGVYTSNGKSGWNRINSEYLELTIKDSVTAITDVTTTTAPRQYYDLQGRRITNPAKGIYIVDGKKVVK